MAIYSLLNDYSEGAHPDILKKIYETNNEQQSGYGNDKYSQKAKELIKAKINTNADIHFVSGGTQANILVIAATLRPHESVISADSGHINFHEAGAIEASGHKINAIIKNDGKLFPEDIEPILVMHDFAPHVVKPAMVYISNTTELGTVYKKHELERLYKFCNEKNLFLFIDGARLGTAITSKNSELSLEIIAANSDAFTIGGTKNGALLGEAIVITNEFIKKDFHYHLKQRGALLAKGRLIGIQFYELFKNDLYFELATYANKNAIKIAQIITKKGYNFLTKPESNQIFPILPIKLIEKLEKKFVFFRWKKFDDNHFALRIVTSWLTDENKVDEFIEMVNVF